MIWLALLPLLGTAWLGLADANWWPLAIVTAMSLLTALAYAHDKRQAIRGGWRIPESRLHLLELCGLVEARVIDLDGVYDPCRPNDRLLLGMKGSISEFELGVIRARMFEAARAKAQRGELRISVPVGYVWHREFGLGAYSVDRDR